MNLHLPASAVAEHDAQGIRTGAVHRVKNMRDAAPRGRNRRRYRTACGRTILLGFPARLAPPRDLCGHCWPDVAKTAR